MRGFNSIDEARAYFSQDRFATENGITLDELSEDTSVCSLVLKPKHLNAYGGVMGGAIFTLADFAFATLTNDRENITVAQQTSINFLSPSKGDTLKAVAKYKKDGRSSSVVTVEVTDNTGRDIAMLTCTGFKMSHKAQ